MAVQAVSLAGAFQEISILPPSFDLLKAMRVVQDMKDLEHAIDDGSRSLRLWRTDTQAKLRLAMEIVDTLVAESGMPKATMGTMIKPQLDKLWEPLEELLESYAQPITERADFPESVGKVTGAPGRFLRKQVQRLEDLRIEQYNAIVDWHYGLLAFASEYDPDNERTASFTEPDALLDHLRKNFS